MEEQSQKAKHPKYRCDNTFNDIGGFCFKEQEAKDINSLHLIESETLKKYGLSSVNQIRNPEYEKFKDISNGAISIQSTENIERKIKAFKEISDFESREYTKFLKQKLAIYMFNYAQADYQSESESYSESDDDNDEPISRLSEEFKHRENIKQSMDIIEAATQLKLYHEEIKTRNEKLKEKYGMDDNMQDIKSILSEIKGWPIKDYAIHLENIWRYFSEKRSLAKEIYDKYDEKMYFLIN